MGPAKLHIERVDQPEKASVKTRKLGLKNV